MTKPQQGEEIQLWLLGKILATVWMRPKNSFYVF